MLSVLTGINISHLRWRYGLYDSNPEPGLQLTPVFQLHQLLVTEQFTMDT